MCKPFLLTLLLLTTLLPLWSQQPVSMRDTHERVVAIVPMIGAGTEEDPRRPMFTPPERDNTGERRNNGIIAWSCKISDDGRFALVELVARDRAALKEILETSHPDTKVFRLGENSRKSIRAELRKFKQDFEFDLDNFGVMVP